MKCTVKRRKSKGGEKIAERRQNSKAKSGDIHKIRQYRIFFDTYPPHITPYCQFDPPTNWQRRLWMAPLILRQL